MKHFQTHYTSGQASKQNTAFQCRDGFRSAVYEDCGPLDAPYWLSAGSMNSIHWKDFAGRSVVAQSEFSRD